MPDPSPDANLAESLRQWTIAFGWRDRVAFLCGDDVYTHGEVHQGAARAAGYLSARGVGPGDRVVIAIPGSIEFVWAFLGVVRLGAIALLADPEASGLPPGEAALCAEGRHENSITPAELITGMPRAVPADPHPVYPDTPAFAQYGAMYAHGDPEAAFLAMGPFGLRENDVLLSVPRTYDPVGLRNTVFLPLFSGASAVLDPGGRRSVASVAERVRRHRASVLLSTSAFFTRLAAEGPRDAFAPLRMAVSHGSPPARAEEWLGCPVVAS